jgi:hypothetical protein
VWYRVVGGKHLGENVTAKEASPHPYYKDVGAFPSRAKARPYLGQTLKTYNDTQPTINYHWVYSDKLKRDHLCDVLTGFDPNELMDTNPTDVLMSYANGRESMWA